MMLIFMLRIIFRLPDGIIKSSAVGGNKWAPANIENLSPTEDKETIHSNQNSIPFPHLISAGQAVDHLSRLELTCAAQKQMICDRQ